MSTPHILTVFGSTGNQGSSVIKQVSARFPGKFHYRAVTRDPNSDKSKKLKQQFPNAQVDVVQADMNNRDQVNAAVKGAYAVFGVTSFWDPEIIADHAKEVTQGKQLVDACVANGVHYFIWSTLADAKHGSNGKYEVPHFSGKAEIAKYAHSQSKLKTICFIPPFYYQNFLAPGNGPQEQADGSYVLGLPMKPDTKIPMYDVDDTGKVVALILEHPDKYVGKEISGEAELVSPEEVVATFSRVKGKPAKFHSVTDEQLKAALPPFMYKEFKEMFGWFDDFGFYGKNSHHILARDVLGAGQLNSLENFFKSHDFSSQKKQ